MSRLTKVADWAAGYFRRVVVSLVLVIGLGLAYAAGANDVNRFLTLVAAASICLVAVEHAVDRARAKAVLETSLTFYRMISTDSQAEITVTHRYVPCRDSGDARKDSNDHS